MNNEKWKKSYKLITDILQNNELGDAYLILQGLELVGYENIDFWFKVIDNIKKYKGIETLVEYVDVMQQIESINLNIYIQELKMKYDNFNDVYNAFVSLLSETKKFNEEFTLIKK